MAITLLSSHGVAHLPFPTSAEHFSDSQQQQRYRIVEESPTEGEDRFCGYTLSIEYEKLCSFSAVAAKGGPPALLPLLLVPRHFESRLRGRKRGVGPWEHSAYRRNRQQTSRQIRPCYGTY
ncbi:hypothetical protein F2Q70_00022524 [Brassica cretica]|uniref:Uncharacterized protein n=1 Tax=Brassica cretica TaxID=69181 RepID=A0A8S9GIX9_BRACR|nr:hypothetical protein F2Q70_00022524 [Brassica cretica]